MTYFESALLGFLEGVTEFLPISSTGHLILASRLLDIPNSDLLKSFEIIIQLGAILAVTLLYWRSLLDKAVIFRLLCGFLPTAIIGFSLYPLVKGYLIGNVTVVLAALAIGGVLLIAFELLHRERSAPAGSIKDITYRQAILVGLFQSIALIPGTSRSAATIIGGLILGLSRVTIVEFSFLLAVPTMAAATAYDIYKNYTLFTGDFVPTLAIGFITAFITALFVITALLKYIKRHTFIPFGIYRIFIAALFILFII